MKKLVRNILTIHTIGAVLMAIIFAFLIFPILLNLEFVKTLLSTPDKGFLTAITALILFLLVYSWGVVQNMWQRYKNTYRLPSPPIIYLNHLILFIILFICFSYLFIVLFQPLRGLIISPEFTYFFIINAIFIMIWFLSSCFFARKETKADTDIDIYSLSDEPIQFVEQDLLGREKFIDNLYKEIINLPFRESFVFGLYGDWGEGKTSSINLLRNKFKANENFLIINFDPWYYRDEEAILSAFYKQIERTINQRFIFPDLRGTFARHRKLISSGLSQAGIKIDFPQSDVSLEETKQKIEGYIIQTGRKIIIFIDDIDRLQAEEILLVFKLVRLHAKFANTIFLLSFDENYVSDILEEKWTTSGNLNNQNLNLIHKRTSYVF